MDINGNESPRKNPKRTPRTVVTTSLVLSFDFFIDELDQRNKLNEFFPMMKV